MVKISRDNTGKTRVAKGDVSGLGGQYAPDPAKIDKNINAFKDLEETLNNTPDWKKYYPAPTFREFDSLDIKIGYEDYDFGMMGEKEFLEYIAPEIEEAWLNDESILFEISHVPNHVEPQWVVSDFTVTPKFFERNSNLTDEEQNILNNTIANVYEKTPSNILVRESEGYVQLYWEHNEPVFYAEGEEFGSEIINSLSQYNNKYHNVTAERIPGDNTLHMSGWYTVSDEEKNILLKALNSNNN